MKAVLISIQPKWVEKIASGKKTVEVRKTKPKIDVPFKCYIYETQGRTQTPWIDEDGHYIFKGRGQVIGEFVCGRIDTIGKRGVDNNFDYCYQSLNVFGNDDIEVEITAIQKSCIPKVELNAYGATSMRLFAWHISDLVIYDKPKDLSEFEKVCQNVTCSLCEYAVRKEGYLVNCEKGLKRPPQSWCYCEELKGEK